MNIPKYLVAQKVHGPRFTTPARRFYRESRWNYLCKNWRNCNKSCFLFFLIQFHPFYNILTNKTLLEIHRVNMTTNIGASFGVQLFIYCSWSLLNVSEIISFDCFCGLIFSQNYQAKTRINTKHLRGFPFLKNRKKLLEQSQNFINLVFIFWTLKASAQFSIDFYNHLLYKLGVTMYLYGPIFKGMLKRGRKSCRAKRYVGTCMKKG